jgi:peroxin-10
MGEGATIIILLTRTLQETSDNYSTSSSAQLGMSDDALNPSSLQAQPSLTTSASTSSYLYPFAASPDIIRSHEKDSFITGNLTAQAQSIVRSLKGARFVHAHADAIKTLAEISYFSLTTLIGNRTLGEEYCDIVQLEDDTLRLPSIARRTGYILSSVLAPWLLQRMLPILRRKIRAKLERSITRQRAELAHRSAVNTTSKNRVGGDHSLEILRFQTYILAHLDSLTSFSPIYAISLAAFYITGSYYHLSKRLWGLRYVFTRRIGESEQRAGYEVLGVLLILQMAVQGIAHVQQTTASFHHQQQESLHSQLEAPYPSSSRKGESLLLSIQHPPSIPPLPASSPRYNLSADAFAMPWILEGHQRKCTLCLEPYKDPSVTTCGHVFCWICVRDWVREKPECPLCRQEVLLSKVLPLRG